MKYYILFLIVIISSCQSKHFLPESDALRDPDLFGTWRSVENIENPDSIFRVFTTDGYYGQISYANNEYLKGFTDLDGLWHNIYLPDGSTSKGKCYIASLTKHWTNGRWEQEGIYYFSKDKDTLFRVSGDNEYKYVHNEYQLKFNKSKYTGME